MAQPGGREFFGASFGVVPQSQPSQGMLLRHSTDICPKELTRSIRGYFNSLLALMLARECMLSAACAGIGNAGLASLNENRKRCAGGAGRSYALNLRPVLIQRKSGFKACKLFAAIRRF